jgi:hypothetical protein
VLWRGVRRITLIAPFTVTFAMLAVLTGAVIAKGSGIARLPQILGYLFAFTVFVLFPAVILLARPKVLIPPALRSERGAIADRIDSWRTRHGRRAGGTA